LKILRANISAQGVVTLIMAKQTFAATVVLILDSVNHHEPYPHKPYQFYTFEKLPLS
jgi:hypothetical protein